MPISDLFLAADRPRGKTTTSWTKAAVLGLAALGVTAISAPAAWAGCGDGVLKQPAAWPTGDDTARLIPAALVTPGAAATIVGLWSVQFAAGNQVVDFGYSEWHADGTEILNSGIHHPATQNFCLGVWQQTGPLSYHLNHWALSYAPTAPPPGAPATPVVKVNIKEDVTLSPQGTTFAGTFSIVPYDFTTGAAIPGGAVSGQVHGERITPY